MPNRTLAVALLLVVASVALYLLVLRKAPEEETTPVSASARPASRTRQPVQQPEAERGSRDVSEKALQERKDRARVNVPKVATRPADLPPARGVRLGEAKVEPPVLEENELFDSSTEYVFSTESANELSGGLEGLTGERGSISLWLRPEWSLGNTDDATLFSLSGGHMRLAKRGEELRFEFTEASGEQRAISTNVASWKPGAWYHVAVVWAEEGRSLYVQGALAAEDRRSGSLIIEHGAKLSAGTPAAEGRPVAPASIKHIQVHRVPFQAADIATRVAREQPAIE